MSSELGSETVHKLLHFSSVLFDLMSRVEAKRAREQTLG